jgi:hypothetical protein
METMGKATRPLRKQTTMGLLVGLFAGAAMAAEVVRTMARV